MYSDHFGLAQNPFTPASTASGPFRSKELEEALAHFQYARLNRESFFLLVGEVGAGKSTAIRAIVESLGQRFPVAVLSHTRLDPRELLEEVLRRFGVDTRGPGSKSLLLERLETFLSSSAEEMPAVLIIDEAHLLSHAALEELRLLSNLEKRNRPLLQICLVGQPELLERLRQHRFRPLRQRIAVRYVFGNLTRQETRQYIWHRLEAAGASMPAVIFTEDAADAVHAMAEGLPREINVVAGQAMLNAYLENSRTVRRVHVRSTKHDYGFEGVRVARGESAQPSPRLDQEAPEPARAAAVDPVESFEAVQASKPLQPEGAVQPEKAVPAAKPVHPEKPAQPLPRGQPVRSSRRIDAVDQEPSDLVLQEEMAPDLDFQSSGSGWRILFIATAVVAAGVLATIAVTLYPRYLVGNALPDPPPVRSRSLEEPPSPSIAPALDPPTLPTTTTSSPPMPELEPEFEPEPVEAPAADVARPRAISVPPQPVSRAAAAADRLERGTWLARNGNLDDAIAAFRDALALEPGYGDALYSLGVTLLEKGELNEAVEVLRKATSIAPNHGLAQRALGIALSLSGSPVEAAACLNRAVELLPNDVFALRHLANVLLESGDYEKSIDATRKAVALMPDDAGLQQELGFALRASGRLAEAAVALQRSIDIDRNLALAHYTLGVTLLEMGNRDAGEREIAEARRLGYDPR